MQRWQAVESTPGGSNLFREACPVKRSAALNCHWQHVSCVLHVSGVPFVLVIICMRKWQVPLPAALAAMPSITGMSGSRIAGTSMMLVSFDLSTHDLS